MAGRRIVFRETKPAAGRRRILFTMRPPYLVDGGPDLDARMSSSVFDVLVKATADAHVGALTPDGEARAHEAREALAKAADAMLMGKPVPLECQWAAHVVHDGKETKSV